MDFVCEDPGALVRAANAKATLDALKTMPGLGTRIAERHALRPDRLRPDTFIHVQQWLDALLELQQTVGPAKLREVGRNIVENADIPNLDSESILLDLDAIYHTNHRGRVGHYRSRRLRDGSIEVRCETPYPRNFEWGLIEGFCRNKKAAGANRYLVEYIDGADLAAHTCSLIVRPTCHPEAAGRGTSHNERAK